MYRLVVFLLSMAVLSGCSMLPKYNKLEVKEKEVVRVKINEELLRPCEPERPISKEEYLKLQPYERETYLTRYAKDLLLTINDCNIKLKKIKEFQDGQ